MYELFRAHPELLDVVEEGMTKEQHRELVRQCLRTIVGAGYSPMRYYVRDLRRYFYLAECTSLVDLSLVCDHGTSLRTPTNVTRWSRWACSTAYGAAAS